MVKSLISKRCPGFATFCKPCHWNKPSEEDFNIRYETRKASCSTNYDWSAPMMEVEGAKQKFARSIANRNVRYMKYLGDGDSISKREGYVYS